jgi:hypothetical protein
MQGVVPNLAGLKIDWRTRQDSRCDALTWLAAIHYTLGNRREVAASFIS